MPLRKQLLNYFCGGWFSFLKKKESCVIFYELFSCSPHFRVMVPKISAAAIVPSTDNEIPKNEKSSSFRFFDSKLRPRWYRILMFTFIHIFAVYGLYLAFTSAKLLTSLWGVLMHTCGMLGLTVGAHRLWSHKSFKAKPPMTFILTFFNTIAYQDCAIRWARDHRLHHKWGETDADPYNAGRGLFFSHIGWILCDRLPEVKAKCKELDLSDLLSDPILRFQKKYYYYLMPLCAFLMPTVVPMYFWEETFTNAFFVNFLRLGITMNTIFCINSVAHKYGPKPYDKSLFATDVSLLTYFSMGEQSHNYHHAFPRDYRSSELKAYTTHLGTLFIDVMAKIGWAYDLKSVPREYIMRRVKKSGDGSHNLWGCKGEKLKKIDEVLAPYKEVY